MARDAKTETTAGRSLYETRRTIDARWSSTGFPTDTPMPDRFAAPRPRR